MTLDRARSRLLDMSRAAVARGLRKVPGSRARSLSRELRDRARLGSADVALVSFPKSGRTFVRAMLARLYQQRFGIDERQLLDFGALVRAQGEVPRLLFTHDNDALRRAADIRINKRAYANTKVLLLARHPGDVAVSRYYHLKHRSRDAVRRRAARLPINEFVWIERGGVPAITAYLNAWAGYARERGDVLILRYEDFLTDPERTLRRASDFIGIAASDDQIANAVEAARFGKLKAKEREGYYSSARLRPRSGDAASSKVRSGRSGGFRDELHAANAKAIDDFIAARLDPVFGYSARATRRPATAAAQPVE